MRLFQILVPLLLYGNLASSHCPQGTLDRHLDDLVHRVVHVGKDRRQTIEEYAAAQKPPITVAAAKARLAAIGLMVCPTGPATVEVVNTGNGISKVVPTSSHPFYTNKCCLISPTECKITFPFSGDKEPFTIDPSTFQTGGCAKQDDDRNKDWAVFSLDRPVRGATPSGIPRRGAPPIPVGQEFITTCPRSDNFIRNGKKPFHIETCATQHQFRFANVPLQTDCNTGGGCSGAGQHLWLGDRFSLAAIHVGGVQDVGIEPGSGYDPDRNFNSSVPLTGEFLESIHDLLEGKVRKAPRKLGECN